MTTTSQILNDYKHVFAEDPIIVTVSTTASDVPQSATLPQIVVRVTFNPSDYPSGEAPYREIAQQFVPGDTRSFDISSALQAEYQRIDRANEPSPNLTSATYYPFVVSIQAYVRYLFDGQEYNGYMSEDSHVQGMVDVANGVYVLRGGLTDIERMQSITSPSAAVEAYATNLSTKPLLPEIKNVGDTHLVSSYNTSTHVVSTTASTISSSGTPPTRVLVEENPNRHQLIFRNSLGVLETFSVLSLSKKTYTVKSESLPILSAPSYTPTNGIYNQTTPPAQKMEMSTGFIPTPWADWFVNEVLTAKYVWAKMDILNKNGGTTSVVRPVHLEASEIVLNDETSPQLAEVKFNMTTLSAQ